MKKLLLLTFTFISTLLTAQPIITQNPSDVVLCNSVCDSISVVANGQNLTYNWQYLDSNMWVSFTSASTSKLEVCGDLSNDSVWVRCVVSDSNGMADTSSSATVITDSCLAPEANFTFTIYGDSVCFQNTSLRATTVLWNFGNGSQSTDMNPCYDYDDFQIFYVKLYAYNDYGVDEIEQEVDLLSLEELSKQWKIYPNPAKDFVYIESSSEVTQVEVVDLVGKRTVLPADKMVANRIDLSGFNTGVYFLLITVGNDVFFERMILE